jgi:hypothetical protein
VLTLPGHFNVFPPGAVRAADRSRSSVGSLQLNSANVDSCPPIGGPGRRSGLPSLPAAATDVSEHASESSTRSTHM